MEKIKSVLTSAARRLSFLLAESFVAHAAAAEFTPGDIIVTDASHVYEYTRTGSLVQTISVPPIVASPTEYVRDSVVDGYGHLHVFNGTFYAGLSNFDPTTGVWQNSSSGLSIVNNGTYGKLVPYNHFVFATNGQSITHVDTINDTAIGFGGQGYNDGPVDITLGHDGLLYSLDGQGSPSGRFIDVFNPDSLDLIRTIYLPSNFVYGVGDASRSIAVDASGSIYLNQLYGPVFKLSPDGQQVITSAHYTQTSYVDDMDYSPDGIFMFTQFDGRVTMLDSSLNEISSFETTHYYYSESFGSFITVPEPGSFTLSAIAFLLIGSVRRRRR